MLLTSLVVEKRAALDRLLELCEIQPPSSRFGVHRGGCDRELEQVQRRARIAIGEALARAGIDAPQIDYINLHGTATIQNDAMESRVVADLFGAQVPVSSTKGLTGHTLGAAAALEAAFCWLAMQDANADGHLPAHLWDGVADPALPRLNVAAAGTRLGRPLRYALSNSFAFGGSNAALVLGRAR
jgi:3-oxoacyl-[acyl-carrier-protein] synthase-1